MVLQEESSAAYDWNYGEATAYDPAPDTTLQPALTAEEPTAVTLASGTSHLFLKGDGSVVSRINVSWTSPADVFVTDGGIIEIGFKPQSASEWEVVKVSGDETAVYLSPVEDSVVYDIRARSINSIGVKSGWTTPLQHTVVGKTAPPNDVSSLTVQQSANVVVFKWPQVSDADLSGYEIRYGPQGSAVWGDGIPLTEVTRGTQITSAAVPPGSWTFMIKARDTSGNYSTNAVSANLAVSNSYDVVAESVEQNPWTGTLTNMVKHWTGKLVPDSQSLASDMTDAQLWDQCTYNPYPTCSYEGEEIDLGFDADGVRVWGDITSTIGPGETGTADPTYQIDYRDGAGSYDGFENWIIAAIDARYIKPKISVDTSLGVPIISQLKTTADVAERTARGEGVTVAVSGTSVVFSQRFHNQPNVQATVQGGTALYAVVSSITTTGFTVTVYNAAGTDVGGTIDWQAIGA